MNVIDDRLGPMWNADEEDGAAREAGTTLKTTSDDTTTNTTTAAAAADGGDDDDDDDEGCSGCWTTAECTASSSYCDCNTNRKLPVKLATSTSCSSVTRGQSLRLQK